MDPTPLLIIWGFSLAVAVPIGLKYDAMLTLLGLTLFLGPLGVIAGYWLAKPAVTSNSHA